MLIKLHKQLPESLHAILVPVRKDRLEAMRQANSAWHEGVIFDAELKQNAILYAGQDKKFFLLGLGEETNKQALLHAVIAWMKQYGKHLPESLGVDCEDDELLDLVVQGIVLGTYSIPQRNKDKSQDIRLKELHLLEDDDPAEAATHFGQVVEMAQTQQQVMDLVNKPANELTPQALGEWAVRSGERYGYQVEVWQEDKIREVGLKALLSVGQASPHPPVFIRAHYKPEGLPEDALRIGLVGKGVTFDTGGVSLKPNEGMHYMKSDMGGASVMLGAMEAVARLRLPLEVELIVCSCENAIGSKAIKPGDVIDSYAGKTIEVLNTDAEGRLILADGLNYSVRHFQSDVLLNAATLTGSCVRTLGYEQAGMFTTNDRLAAALESAAAESGEELWRLPLRKEHGKLLKSEVADLKNMASSPLAGASVAAKFLESFTEEHPAWAHLDVAGTVFGNTPFSKEKNATGYGVFLLIRLFEQMLEEPERWKR